MKWSCLIVVACFLAVASRPIDAEARPLRGPLMRAERRMARAQAVIERERVVAPRAVSATAPVPRVATGSEAAAGSPPAPNNAVKSAAPTGPRAAAPERAAPQPEVARAGYEAPVRPLPAAGGSSAAAEPAADGTVSVLVRPDAPRADQPAEPLRFPSASAP